MSTPPNFSVDVCVTCVADTPPKLPLREELQSLGVEVIYNASGTAERASNHTSKKAIKRFRQEQQVKEMRKLRIFPSSSAKIKQKLQQRRQAEQELGMPHAVSYEDYDHELARRLHSRESSNTKTTKKGLSSDIASSADSASTATTAASWLSPVVATNNSKKKKGRSIFGFRKRSGSLSKIDHDDTFMIPSSHSVDNGQQQLSAQHDLFPDIDFDGHVIRPSLSADDALYTSSAPRQQRHQQQAQNSIDFPDLLAQPNDTTHYFPARIEEEYHAHNDDDENDNGDIDGGIDKLDDDIDKLDDDYYSLELSSDNSSISSNSKDNIDSPDLDIRVVASAESAKQLPGLASDDSTKDVQKVKSIDEQVISAFSNLYSKSSELLGGIMANNRATPKMLANEAHNPAQKAIAPASLPSIHDDDFEEEQQFGFSSSSSETEGFDDSIADAFAAFHSNNPIYHNPKQPFNDVFSPLGDDDELGTPVAAKDSKSNNNNDAQSNFFIETQKSLTNWVQSSRANFGQLTAEVMEATSHMSLTPVASPTNKTVSNLLVSNADLLTCAKSAAETMVNNVCSGHDEDMHIIVPTGMSEDEFFGKISAYSIQAAEIAAILNVYPHFVKLKSGGDGRFPLHFLCDRGLESRTEVSRNELTTALLQDISNYQRQVEVVYELYPEVASIRDDYGDLPVHILARRFMEWEAEWYETVYSEAAKERDSNGSTAEDIASLYKCMSFCIETLLEPLLDNNNECTNPGSIGILLPVHIACIFSSKVRTLRQLLEIYPESATIKCDLDNIGTFIPDGLLPIELHDKLSTDFPKWETEFVHPTNTELKWSQTKDSETELPDRVRRSDLLFAYAPYVKPYCLDLSRRQRIEALIRLEAKKTVEHPGRKLSAHTELMWKWLCTQKEDTVQQKSFLESVDFIIQNLSLKPLRLLAYIKEKDGKVMINAAAPERAASIRKKLEEIASSIVLPKKISPAASKVAPPADAAESPQHSAVCGREELLSLLCQKIFNIPHDTQIPFSFIVLPYKLRKKRNGKLCISPADTEIAEKFAKLTLQITDARSILYFIDQKSRRHYDVSIYDNARNEGNRQKAFKKVQQCAELLVSLYQPGRAFLYFVDSSKGLPVLSEDFPMYPIALSESLLVVKKLLPLMLTGMLMMRGDKAIAVFLKMLLDDSMTVMIPNWDLAAKELALYLYSQDAQKSPTLKPLLHTRRYLTEFPKRYAAKNSRAAVSKTGKSEWTVELSLLKMLVHMRDDQKLYAGLELKMGRHNTVNWVMSNMVAKKAKAVVPQPDDKNKTSESNTKGATYEVLKEKHQDLAEQLVTLKSQDKKSHKHNQVDNASVNDDSVLEIPQPRSDVCSEYRPGKEYHFCYANEPNMAAAQLQGVMRYSLLFGEFSVNDRLDYFSARSDLIDRNYTWSEAQRIWCEIMDQLNICNVFLEDNYILYLRVDLAKEARRLACMDKDCTEAHRECRDISGYNQMQSDLGNDESFAEHTKVRKLIIRLAALEERVLCSEIELQHMSMQVFAFDNDLIEYTPPWSHYCSAETDESSSTVSQMIQSSISFDTRKASNCTISQDRRSGSTITTQSDIPSPLNLTIPFKRPSEYADPKELRSTQKQRFMHLAKDSGLLSTTLVIKPTESSNISSLSDSMNRFSSRSRELIRISQTMRNKKMPRSQTKSTNFGDI